MINLTFYDSEGRFRLIFSGDNSIIQAVIDKQAEKGYNFVVGSYSDELDYFDIQEGLIKPRPSQDTLVSKTQIFADGLDEIIIENPPTDATFTAYNMTTGELISGTMSSPDTFASESQGFIRLTIEKFPYKIFEVLVHAV